MNEQKEKRSQQAENEQQPGDLSSFNKRDIKRSTESEGAEKKDKDETESNTDFNGNSEAKSPGREGDQPIS